MTRAGLPCGSCTAPTAPPQRPGRTAVSQPASWRKRNADIQAIQWHGDNTTQVLDWVRANGGKAAHRAYWFQAYQTEFIVIDTPAEEVPVDLGNWVALLPGGEFFAIEDATFVAEYEPADTTRVIGGDDGGRATDQQNENCWCGGGTTHDPGC